MTTTPPRTRPSRILWIEDDQDLREMLADELMDAGYAVAQAANGREAVDRLRHFRPDLILCDIAMPQVDGYQLLHLVRNGMPELCDVPFIFLSAQDGSEQIIQGKYAGADDYLVKPVNFDLMLATIAARLRQVRRMREQTHDETRFTAHPGALASRDPRQTFQHLARMFNLISAGIVLLDSQGRIQFANIAAQRMMLDCADPSAQGLFHAEGLQGVPTLATVIRAATESSLAGDEYEAFLSLPRRHGQRDLLATICALECTDDGADTPAVVLFLSAGERDEPAPIKALEALFKLTPTEGRIAWSFAQGLRPEQIAEAFGISATTVAFHKRNIFQKTHTNRQADLIALLLTLPATVKPSGLPSAADAPHRGPVFMPSSPR